MKFKISITLALLAMFFLIGSAYIVDETEQVVVTRFEKVNRIVTDPGLKLRIPLIEKTMFFPKKSSRMGWRSRSSTNKR